MLGNELFICEIPLPRADSRLQSSFEPVLVPDQVVRAVEGRIPEQPVDDVCRLARYIVERGAYLLLDGVCSPWYLDLLAWGEEAIWTVGLLPGVRVWGLGCRRVGLGCWKPW